MLINLKNGSAIFARDKKRYVSPAPIDQPECGQRAPKWPYYRCTRAAGHEETDTQFPHTHAAHGSHRGGMFAVWQEEESSEATDAK